MGKTGILEKLPKALLKHNLRIEQKLWGERSFRDAQIAKPMTHDYKHFTCKETNFLVPYSEPGYMYCMYNAN